MSESDKAAVILRGFGGFTFDAIFEEDHNMELEVTENPVETGVSITDHAFMKPHKVRMLVGVTNHQMVPSDDGFGLADVRAKNAFKKLEALMRSRDVFDVQTGLKLYRNMICTNLHTLSDASTANSLVFTAELREVIIVSTQAVAYPPRKKGKPANQAAKKKESGEKQGKEVPAEQPKQKNTILKGMSKAWRGK